MIYVARFVEICLGILVILTLLLRQSERFLRLYYQREGFMMYTGSGIQDYVMGTA
jgi:hypothetical protein